MVNKKEGVSVHKRLMNSVGYNDSLVRRGLIKTFTYTILNDINITKDKNGGLFTKYVLFHGGYEGLVVNI